MSVIFGHAELDEDLIKWIMLLRHLWLWAVLISVQLIRWIFLELTIVNLWHSAHDRWMNLAFLHLFLPTYNCTLRKIVLAIEVIIISIIVVPFLNIEAHEIVVGLRFDVNSLSLPSECLLPHDILDDIRNDLLVHRDV